MFRRFLALRSTGTSRNW